MTVPSHSDPDPIAEIQSQIPHAASVSRLSGLGEALLDVGFLCGCNIPEIRLRMDTTYARLVLPASVTVANMARTAITPSTISISIRVNHPPIS